MKFECPEHEGCPLDRIDIQKYWRGDLSLSCMKCVPLSASQGPEGPLWKLETFLQKYREMLSVEGFKTKLSKERAEVLQYQREIIGQLDEFKQKISVTIDSTRDLISQIFKTYGDHL